MGGGVVNMLSVVVRIMYSVVVRTPLNNRHEWDTSRLPAHSRWRVKKTISNNKNYSME